ncbi:MAG: MarR family transcriptional regulator [Gemmatimonadales bacterium]
MSTSQKTRNEDLADRLHSAAIHLLRTLRRVDDETGLTAPRLSVLSVLVFAGPRTLGQLATAEQVRPPTMTRLVAALEEDGFVGRSPDKTDGRVTIVSATKKGEAVMWLGRSRRVKSLAARLDSLTRKELSELNDAATLIERVSKNV